MSEERIAPQFHITATREGTTQGERIGVDVQVNITSFAFEDTEGAVKLAFEVDNFDLSQFDDPTFVNGDLISATHGYDGNMSPAIQAVVMNSFGGHRSKRHKTVSLKQHHTTSDASKEGGIKLKIEAIGKEILMNKERKTRSFTNMRRCDVARQIAQEQGYSGASIQIDDQGVGQPVILQSRMSDYELLRQLAHKDGVEVYIDADGFHYHRRKVGEKPIKTLTYYADATGADPGTIISFSVSEDRTAKPGAINAVGIDPLKKTLISATGNDASASGRPVLAPVLTVLGEKVNEQTGAITPDAPLQTRVSSATTVVTTATTQADAQHQADGAYTKTQQAAVIVKLHCVGDPLIRAKQVIGIQGIGARHNGLYYVKTCKHQITTSGYTMDLECRRDGANHGTGVSGHNASPQQLASLKSQIASVQNEALALQASVAANPALANDPDIQKQALALNQTALSLSNQLSRASGGGVVSSSGVQNTQVPAAAGALTAIEVVDEVNGVTRVEWR